MNKKNNPKRIVIYGSPGSGKTSLAKNIMKVTNIEAYSLDDIFHGENWVHLSRSEFRKRVRILVEKEKWIIDGNYSSVRQITLKRANLVLILDLQPYIIIWRVVLRTLGRKYPVLQKLIGFNITPLPKKVEESGNKENIFEALREFIPKALKFRNKRSKPIIKDIDNLFNHKQSNIIYLRSQNEINNFLTDIANIY